MYMVKYQKEPDNGMASRADYNKLPDIFNNRNEFRVKGIIRSCGFLRIFTYKDDGLFLVR